MDDKTAREKRDHELSQFVQAIREQLNGIDPKILARNTGTHFDEGLSGFEVNVMGRHFLLQYPSFIARELAVEHHEGSLWVQTLLMHYFRTADGAPIKHEWISFRELPDGMNYEKAFQGYSGDKLAKAIGNDGERLRHACRRLRGTPVQAGDIAYRFEALPRIPLAIAYWAGDEDFPADARVLFDRSAPHYMPTDGLAVIGGRMCNLILYAAGLIEDPFAEQEEHGHSHGHDQSH